MPKIAQFNREEVMDRVTQLFWKKGFHATSMQDLVDTTGLNRSSIYNSFGDKFQLFEESLHHYQIQQMEMTAKCASEASSPLEAIKKLFYTILCNIENDAEKRGCLLSNCTTELANADTRIRKFLSANRKTMLEIFERHIREAQDLAEISPEKDPEVSAIYLYSSLHGLQITGMLGAERKTLKLIVERILENI